MVDDVDRSAVQLDRPAGDSEAETRTAAVIGASASLEPLEDGLAVGLGDSGTLIAHFDGDMLASSSLHART